MKLHHETDGPKIDPGVTARLARLDKDLTVTFSRWFVDAATSLPLHVDPNAGTFDEGAARFLKRRGNTWLLECPHFDLWVWDGREGRHHHVAQYEVTRGFGHREVQKLEGDAARFMSPSELVREHYRLSDIREAKELADGRELRADIVEANKGVINDVLVGDGAKTYRPDRDAKIYSYEGQGSHGSTGIVTKDDKEAGWEKPDRS